MKEKTRKTELQDEQQMIPRSNDMDSSIRSRYGRLFRRI
jgi:hypothetical protein